MDGYRHRATLTSYPNYVSLVCMLDASFLPLTNERVRLRRLRNKDASAFAEGTEDVAVRTYGHLPESEYTPASVVTMIATQAEPCLNRGDLAVLAIAEVANDTFAGSLVLFDVTDETAEVGFWLHPDHRSAGLASSALSLAFDFARSSGLSCITARTIVEKAASQRVRTRVGFTETVRQADSTPSGQEHTLHADQRGLRCEPAST